MEEIYMSYIDREVRARLNALSKQVWGAPSAWMKYLDRGILVPGQIKCPRTGAPATSERKWYTIGAIEVLMLDLLKKMQETSIKKV